MHVGAQTTAGMTYEGVRNAPVMQWVCPEIEDSLNLIYSVRNKDYKIYAENLKEKFGLYKGPNSTENSIVAHAVIKIENSLFDPNHLLEYISNYIKRYNKWGQNVKVDQLNKEITSDASFINVANHTRYIRDNSVSISPKLFLKILNEQNIEIYLSVDKYKNDERGSDGNLSKTIYANVSDVYPFDPKSAYKNTYSKAYVGTYNYVWDFIYNLRNDLNKNFTKDEKLLTDLHYRYSRDSLAAIYGEPTQVFTGFSKTPDVNKEIYFYQKTKKVLITGMIFDFKDIVTCEMDDDSRFIPGSTTTYGSGITIFGIEMGGTTTTSTPDVTIHNYLVKNRFR